MKNSKIVLCHNIKLDKSYKNVIDYTENEMVTLCYNNEIAHQDNYTFIKHDGNIIDTSFTYQQCLTADYIAFQNPYYSNKWFFAFIDKVEYRSNMTTRIYFTVDVFATWFDYWNPKRCFVLREHVNDDTIGLHTIDEGLEHGSYIISSTDDVGANLDLFYIIMETTYIPEGFPGNWDAIKYGGVFSGTYRLAFETAANANAWIKAMDTQAKKDAIISMYMAPASLCLPITWNTGTLSGQTITVGAIGTSQGAVIINNKNITIPMLNNINSYQPKNNKLFCYPYNFITFTNNNGINTEYKYEDFINNNAIFSIAGVVSNGCSVKLYPNNYLKINDGEDNTGKEFNYGIAMGKLPTCSWQSDLYTNYLTEQSLNQGLGFVKASVGSVVSGNPIGMITNIADVLVERKTHELVPPQARGTNTADVSFAMNKTRFTYYITQIRSEYAKQIDDYLTKYGYKCNLLKLPNQTGRRYWNYVKISGDDDIAVGGGVPGNAMEEINNIYRQGVTIWHDHANIGNYALDNTII